MTSPYEKDGVRIGLLASEDPPKPRRGNRERQDAIDALLPLLREQRNTWFRIGEFPKRSSAGSAASRLRKHYEGYEWSAVANGEGSALYGRYVGRKKK